MTLGDSLIWITLILLTTGGIYLITKRKKWRLVAKIVGVLILIGIVIGIGAWAWNWYENRPQVVTKIGDISLGMTPIDVTLALGKPNLEAPATGEDQTSRFYYFDYDNELNYLIRFSKDSGVERAVVVCTENSYRKIFGLGKYNDEDKIIEKLGKPTTTSIRADGLAKFISYSQWKVAFSIEKGQVKNVCVTNSGEVKFLDEYK
jgi:hypothetical protein